MLAITCALQLSAADDVIYLSDLTPTSSVIRNDNWKLGVDVCSYYGGPITVAGVQYAKGISSHASNADKPATEFVYDISALNVDTFTAVFGKDDGADLLLSKHEKVIFAISGAGRVLHVLQSFLREKSRVIPDFVHCLRRFSFCG